MNRKTRKLQFIRAKNKIRMGATVVAFTKVSREAIDSTEAEHILSKLVDNVIYNEGKKWNLGLQATDFSITQMGTAFTQDLFTFKISLKHV